MLGKLSFINKIVSKNLGLEEKKVADVNNFVFQELERQMRECKYPFIYIRGLGTFTLKVRTIERVLRRDIGLYRTLRKKTGKRHVGTWEQAANAKRDSIMGLFKVRRLIRDRLRENKKLRNDRKSIDDHKGQCLQTIE